MSDSDPTFADPVPGVKEEGAEEGQGVEAESLEDDASDIVRPFDPTEISIATKTPVVDLVVKRLEHGEIDLDPEFQRHPDIWDRKRQSRLIESLLLRIPLPIFYMAADNSGRWQVVDGLQRLSSIKNFVLDKTMKLRGLEYLDRFEGCHYDDLPRNMQRRIDETELTFHVIDARTSAEVTSHVFNRLNTGGKPLTPQEIRHALTPGPARDLLKELAESDEFLLATDNSISPLRMADRECVLRFIAFYCQALTDYTGHLDRFLIRAMQRVNDMDDQEKETLRHAFLDAMRLARTLFGNTAFRKPSSASSGRSVINKPLFEAMAVALARVPEASREMLIGRQDVLRHRLHQLMADEEFHNSISVGTQTTKRVHSRFRRIDQLVAEVLND